MTVNHVDLAYRNLVLEIDANGEFRSDRTGVGTKSVFGYQYSIPVSEEAFPILTTKKVIFKSVVKELLWFIAGQTNIKDLDCGIWNEWADESGELKHCYGEMWRFWPGEEGTVDQLKTLIHSIKTNPFSRRHIVSAWNPDLVEKASLPWCHAMFQCYVRSSGHLDLQMYQRSADAGCGVPFNISSYCLLLILLARECGLKPGKFVHSFGDLHLYTNHIDKVLEQIQRIPYSAPRLVLPDTSKKSIWMLKPDDIALESYNHHPFVKLDIAI